MNKAFIIIGLVALTLLASCGTKSDEYTASDYVVPTTGEQGQVASTGSIADSIELAANYNTYSDSLLGNEESTVIFFHQESCSTCRTTEANLIEGGVPTGLQVLKVDIDSDDSVELKKKYGVTMKHTFVQVDADGEMIKKWNGSLTVADITEQIGLESTAMVKEEETMMKKDEDVMLKEGEIMEKVELAGGVFTDYNASLVGKTEDTVLFFHASWCSSCRAAESGIAADIIPENLTILKADFDTSIDLKKEYGVVSQHTFVQVDSEGNEVKKWLGGNSVADVLGKLK